MSTDREAQFKQLVAEFPDSPMGHFSLGKLYLDARRYAEAVVPLEEAVRLDGQYAAALVALGDAYAGAGQREKARELLTRARETALGQSHASLAEDIDSRLEDL
ncbi:MAG: tetratricopeptide repeat protein [Myxococcota bacterium]|nr:tetratricopeptide repeat protein [Myxococcota bacterium]